MACNKRTQSKRALAKKTFEESSDKRWSFREFSKNETSSGKLTKVACFRLILTNSLGSFFVFERRIVVLNPCL